MTTQESIQKEAVRSFIRSLKGRFFTLAFEKADGSITIRNAAAKRMSALATSGKGSTLDNAPVIPFYDNNKKAWRAFNVNRLISIKCGNRIFTRENS